MVGGVGEGFASYLKILRYVGEHRIDRTSLVAWLKSEFQLEESYAKNVATMLLFGTGLIETLDGGYCVVTDSGRQILEHAKPALLYESFAPQFVGITEIVDILNASQPLSWEKLFDAWHAKISTTSQEAAKWKKSHAKMQFRHRLDWLRSLSIVNKLADSFYLLKAGMEDSTQRRLKTAKGKSDAEKISHGDIEDKLKLIGDFFQFMSIKRAAVNEARPENAPKLTENRQLDCLWARVVHFGGKVQYAFEVQVGGNISDAIERLEMVASFVQKAIVITDETQREVIKDRLAVKQSPLRDKILFLSYDDINNVAEAVNALKVFTQKVFHE
jgi:hypothetical protein